MTTPITLPKYAPSLTAPKIVQRAAAGGLSAPHFQPHKRPFSTISPPPSTAATKFILVREYSARENGCQGKSAYELFKKLHNKNSYYFDDFITLAKHLVDKLSAFDMLVVMGAGDIVKLCDLLV